MISSELEEQIRQLFDECVGNKFDGTWVEGDFFDGLNVILKGSKIKPTRLIGSGSFAKCFATSNPNIVIKSNIDVRHKKSEADATIDWLKYCLNKNDPNLPKIYHLIYSDTYYFVVMERLVDTSKKILDDNFRQLVYYIHTNVNCRSPDSDKTEITDVMRSSSYFKELSDKLVTVNSTNDYALNFIKDFTNIVNHIFSPMTTRHHLDLCSANVMFNKQKRLVVVDPYWY